MTTNDGDMCSYWYVAMDYLQTNKDWIEPLAQIISPFIAAALVIWQVKRQHHGDILLQRENIKYEVKQQLHKEIAFELEKVSKASIAASIWNSVNFAVITQRAAIQAGIAPSPINVSLEDFNGAYYHLVDCCINLIRIIEQYEIVQPEIKIFQDMINVRLHDIRNAQMPLMQELVHVLPQKASDGISTIYKPAPTDERMVAVERLAAAYEKILFDVGSLVYDFNIEIQNVLLSDLFGRKAPKRKPIDPNEIVISTEKEAQDKLHQYIEASAWGQERKATDERVRSQYRQSQ